jgi:hypothetical protein
MTVAEYLTTFVAIIVSLAVADPLISLHRLLRAGSRVRWFWIPSALALYMLLLSVNFWWGNYFRFVRLTQISMIQFLPTLGSLVILFLMLAAVLPDEVPERGLDLKGMVFRERPLLLVPQRRRTDHLACVIRGNTRTDRD